VRASLLCVLLGCATVRPAQGVEADDEHAEALLLAGHLDEAAAAFERLRAAHPDFAPAYQGLACVAFHRADHAAGLEWLRGGVAVTPPIDPSYARTRLLEDLAAAHFDAGQESAAMADLQGSVAALALSASTTAAVFQLGRARLFVTAGRFDDAAEALRAARTTPLERWVATGADALEVQLLARSGQVPEAVARLEALERAVGPTHGRVLEPRFDVALAQGHLEFAGEALAALEQSDPYAAEGASLRLARALLAAHRDDQARTLLTRITGRFLRSVPSAFVRTLAVQALR
jgi:tetratricopeptide (TPR) repeat protein